MPGARVYCSGDVAISTGAYTAIPFDSERWDDEAIHDTVTNNSRLTCQTAGRYLIVAHIRWEGLAQGNRQLGIRLNGTTYIDLQSYEPEVGTWDTPCRTITSIYDLSVGDYVEAVVYQNGQASLDLMVEGQRAIEFAMEKVGV